jgi:hypothetical protein
MRDKITKAAVGVIGLTVAATISYQIREIVAALLIFSLVFGVVGSTLLLLALIQEVALWGVAGVGAHIARLNVRHSLPSTRHTHHQRPA